MNKWLLSIVAVILLFVGGGILYFYTMYYPVLPIDSMTGHEVVKVINKSRENVVRLTEEKGYDWYITKKEQAFENLIILMQNKGWTYNTQEGAGYFFQKDNEALIVVSQMWSSKYVIYQIPIMNKSIS